METKQAPTVFPSSREISEAENALHADGRNVEGCSLEKKNGSSQITLCIASSNNTSNKNSHCSLEVVIFHAVTFQIAHTNESIPAVITFVRPLLSVPSKVDN